MQIFETCDSLLECVKQTATQDKTEERCFDEDRN
jgi:hypothetical protein